MPKPGLLTGRLPTLLVLIMAPLVLVAVLALAVQWRMNRQVREASRELALEYQALSTVRWPRPSHVDLPTPGTFAQAIGPVLPELLRFHSAQTNEEYEEQEYCQLFLRRQRPVSELPPECGQWRKRAKDLVRRALRASRSEERDRPEELRALLTVDDMWASLNEFFQLAALETRLQAEAGQADAAVETCLDALALSRDLGSGGAEWLAELSAQASDMLFMPCHAALSRASAPRLRSAAVALRHLREGLRPLSFALHEESVHASLRAACGLLDDDGRKSLPTAFRTCLAPDDSLDTSMYARQERFFREHTFLMLLRNDRRIVSLVDLPSAQRGPQLEDLARRRTRSWNPIFASGLSRGGTLADGADLQRTQVDLLLALTWVKTHRAEQGEWPSALPALYPERAVFRPTVLGLRGGSRGTLLISPKNPELRALLTSAGAPIEVTARP